MATKPPRQQPKQGHRQRTGKATAFKFSGLFLPNTLQKGMEKIVGVAQLYFMPHPLLEIVQRLMAHPVVSKTYLGFPSLGVQNCSLFKVILLVLSNSVLPEREIQDMFCYLVGYVYKMFISVGSSFSVINTDKIRSISHLLKY